MKKNHYFKEFNILTLFHLIRLIFRPFIFIFISSLLFFFVMVGAYITYLNAGGELIEVASVLIKVQPSLRVVSFYDMQNNAIQNYNLNSL